MALYDRFYEGSVVRRDVKGADMEIVRDQTFADDRISIDGMRFENCVFENTRLVYAATDTFEFSGCTFISCNWVFDGAALRTLRFLAALNDGLGMEGEHLVEAIFQSVQDGTLEQKLFAPEVASAA